MNENFRSSQYCILFLNLNPKHRNIFWSMYVTIESLNSIRSCVAVTAKIP